MTYIIRSLPLLTDVQMEADGSEMSNLLISKSTVWHPSTAKRRLAEVPNPLLTQLTLETEHSSGRKPIGGLYNIFEICL